MRSDMAKVIVERPRIGGGVKTPKGSRRRNQRFEMNDLAQRESIRSPWRGWDERKEFNENLAPLHRFLQKHLGQPWDNVHSEIRKEINADSAVQHHVLQHLAIDVSTSTVLIDGKVYDDRRCLVFGFYVHPLTKRLCFKPYHKYRRPKDETKYLVVDGKYFRKFNDIWYEITLVPVSEKFLKNKPDRHLNGCTYPSVFDFCLRQRVYSYYHHPLIDCHGLIDGKIVFASGKRQLNTKEIRRITKN